MLGGGWSMDGTARGVRSLWDVGGSSPPDCVAVKGGYDHVYIHLGIYLISLYIQEFHLTAFNIIYFLNE